MKIDFKMVVNKGGVRVVEAVLAAFLGPRGFCLVALMLGAWCLVKWADRL